ncbi:MAG: hypothetical protein DME25_00080 [Verrucomicrobia bacterium]|nr:MAG: hypothetical protein DME25_00080 [Verrucomicrobiota bacterium]
MKNSAGKLHNPDSKTQTPVAGRVAPCVPFGRIGSFSGARAVTSPAAGAWLAALAFLLAATCAQALGAENGQPAAPAAKTEDTNSLDMLRNFNLQLQEQVHQNQLTLERYREEANETAVRNAESIAARFKTIEQSLAFQRGRELETMQSSNRLMVVVAGTVAGVGFIAMLLMAYFQWRLVNRLGITSAALPPTRLALGPGSLVGGPGAGETQLVTVGPVEQTNVRLFDVVERLEKRIQELEHTSHPPLSNGPSNSNGPSIKNEAATVPPAANPERSADFSPQQADGQTSPSSANSDSTVAILEEEAPTTEAGRITVLLAKGQSLLNLDKAEDSLACFDEVLAIQANNADALVKKGTALERLRKLDEAIECYDRAIAADSSLTIAYLCKGGLFNRLERFSEALECYEQALRTQEKRRG